MRGIVPARLFYSTVAIRASIVSCIHPPRPPAYFTTAAFCFHPKIDQRSQKDITRGNNRYYSSVYNNKERQFLLKMQDTISSDDDVLPVIEHNSPFLVVKEGEENEKRNVVLVVLNSPILSKPNISPIFERLWSISSYRICADGGANYLYSATNKGGLIPDLIRGDLDSLKTEVREYYQSKQVPIEKDPDQNTNDLDKALQAVRNRFIMSDNSNATATTGDDDNLLVCVYGAFGGRFDQEMASMQALYKWTNGNNNSTAVFKPNQLIMYDDYTCAFLLPSKYNNIIQLPFYGDDSSRISSSSSSSSSIEIGEGPTCGIIPMGGRCDIIQTSGLKWNLDGTIPLEFGGLISTSNHIEESKVSITVSHPVIFTAEMTTKTNMKR